MMIDEYRSLVRTPTLQNPPRVIQSDPTANLIPSLPSSPLSVRTPTADYDSALTALYRYMHSNNVNPVTDEDDLAIPIDGAYASSDEFRMYEFKVRDCTRSKAHDWTECPFAHPGEKARRRDPLLYSYSGTACTDFRKGGCVRGDACDFAHGVFECWLHPARYRTQACKDGPDCTRRVCFFAHAPHQLRVLSGLPSPRSIGSGSGSDPYDDAETPLGRAYGFNELVASLRSLQMSSRFGPTPGPSFYSLPTTPTGPGYWDPEEPAIERLQSGRALRATMFHNLSKNNPLSLPDPVQSDPDIGWVTELFK